MSVRCGSVFDPAIDDACVRFVLGFQGVRALAEENLSEACSTLLTSDESYWVIRSPFCWKRIGTFPLYVKRKTVMNNILSSFRSRSPSNFSPVFKIPHAMREGNFSLS